MKTVIAIDPGKVGGIAWQNADGEIRAMPMPETYGQICSTLRTLSTQGGEVVVYLEESIAFSRFSSVAVLIAQNNFMQGVLMALGVSLQMVKPQKWQKALDLGSKGSVSKTLDKKQESSAKSGLDKKWKKKLLSHAERFFPTVDPVNLCTCDALLILKYAQKELREK